MMIKFSDTYSRLFDIRSLIFRGMVFVLFMLLFCNDALAVDEEFLEYCVGEAFDKKYKKASCWSCDIIKILLRSMMSLTETLFKEIKELSILILQLGAGIWLALYLMKALGSMTAQDPAKIMDGILRFMFKWAFVYAMIFAGLDVIMQYIVNPILSVGLEIGTEIATASAILAVLGV